MSGTRVRYFVRDDDIGEKTPALEAFARVFAARRVPVSYQIIPSRLTPECAAFLLALEKEYPGLIEFGQHGLHHEMMLGERRLKREFGPERTLQQQTSDILAGRALLAERLGNERQIDVFTPPQHKFDRNTVKAAAAAGHRVLSVAAYATPHHQLAYALGRSLGLSSIKHHGISHHGRTRPEADIREISIAIAIDDGRKRILSADDLGAAMTGAARTSSIVGLMFHHALYQTPRDHADLSAIADALASHGVENFYRLGALAT